MRRFFLSAALTLSLCSLARAQSGDLLTVAEASDFTRTASHAQVLALIDRIDDQSSIMRRGELGKSVKGKSLPLLIFSDPPVENAAQARASGKPIFFAFGNIHAGEVCGKEALLMLARELATTPNHPLLEKLVIVLAPIYNPDGNDQFGPNERHRRGQHGPVEMGRRPNAQDLDLNRDYIKLETQEARAMVRFATEWDPHVIMDLHTTNGSHHRYTLNYETPRHPAAIPGPVEYARNEILPVVTKRVFEKTGYHLFYYGNFNWRGPPQTWATYEGKPRFGGHYHGLRGTIAILSEAYSYASYKDRILCTKAFVEEVMTFTAENADAIRKLHDETRREVIEAGKNPQPTDTIALRHRIAASNRPATILGYEMEIPEQGRPRPTSIEKDYTLVHLDRYESTLSVTRPYAYLIPHTHEMRAIIEKLTQHGITVEPFEGEALCEVYTITSVERAEREFQGHKVVLADAEANMVNKTYLPGSHIVYTAQPLGTLLVYLLEPMSSDGLVAWNFFDDYLTPAPGSEFPITRIRSKQDLNLAPGEHTGGERPTKSQGHIAVRNAAERERRKAAR